MDRSLMNLEALEQKIEKAAEHISRLREEKIALERSNKELKEKLDSLYIKNEQLSREIESLRAERHMAGDFEKTREEIKNKVEEMLAKLDQLEI